MEGAFTVLVHIGEEILGSFSSVVLISSIISVLSVLPQDTQEYSEEMPPRFVWTYTARHQKKQLEIVFLSVIQLPYQCYDYKFRFHTLI